ncbi:unnamed protein product [Rhizoctonia solani]|uniref:Laminin domain protein n=1 Tax=Rhizoctonia solani TaxID=456999 RepID=A0A8H3BKN0_9AGAM|nr:unnamed protein product [Rhizoctonia solani]
MTEEELRASRTSHTTGTVYTPPTLPSHLANIYALNPIVGHPSNGEIKAIHAAIRAVNAEAYIPHLYNPDLSLELSQHLFNVQLAVHRGAYPLSILPGEHTYTPPTLPAHIPIPLEPITGTPTKEQVKAVQSALRVAESQGSSPLFDADLNMDLSQHLFNLQFARYIQSSTLGQFASGSQEPQRLTDNTQGPQSNQPDPQNNSTDLRTQRSSATQPVRIEDNVPERVIRPSVLEESGRLETSISTGIAQLGETAGTIKELMSESKGVLENINRVLIATQRNHPLAGPASKNGYLFVNPVNQEGTTAVECGLPPLRYYCGSYVQGSGYLNLDTAQIVDYLKFFDVGADLIEGGQGPRLKEGRQSDAEKLIVKHIGLNI